MRLQYNKKTLDGETLESFVDEDSDELVIIINEEEVLRCPNTKFKAQEVYHPFVKELTEDRPEAPKKKPSKESKKKSPKSGGGD
jgi:hypothetical protein